MATDPRSAARIREPLPMTNAELLAVVRFYISSCSMPLQGPISGAINFVRGADVVRALDELEARSV